MKISAGILAYRQPSAQEIEYFLVRPGGPFYDKKDGAIWTIPKGIVEEGENEAQAAKREFKEETGYVLENEIFFLGETTSIKGKKVVIYAAAANVEAGPLKSNFFEMEYPKNSGIYQKFPEVVEGEWFSYDEAQRKIFPKLAVFIEMLKLKLII